MSPRTFLAHVLALLLAAAGSTHAQLWQTKATAPTGRAQSAIAADTSGNIYVLGGWNNSSVFNSVDIYNSTTNTWTSGPAMPVATRGASAVYYNNNIYVVGGYDSGQINLIQVLNLTTNTWTQATLPGSGWETTAAVVGNQIIVFGGESNIAQTFSFDPANNSTSLLANNLNNSRGSQALALGNKVYLVGAEGPNYDPSSTILDVYNTTTNTWSSTPADDALARTQFAAGTDGRYLFVAGGSSSLTNNTFPYYTSFAYYDTQTDIWQNGTALPVGLRESAGLYLNGSFYVFGGNTSSGVSSTLYAIQAVPEPATIFLLVAGVASLALLYRRRLTA